MNFHMPAPGFQTDLFKPVYAGFTRLFDNNIDGEIAQPNQTLVGDMVIAHVFTPNGSVTLTTPPANGWTALYSHYDDGNGNGASAYWKIATVAGLELTPFSFITAVPFVAQSALVRGGGQKSIVGNYYEAFSPTTPNNPPDVLHGSRDRSLVCVAFLCAEDNNFSSQAAPSNMTKIYATDSGSITAGLYRDEYNQGSRNFGKGYNVNAWNTATNGWFRQLVVVLY
jgi:hypothetical protein